MAAPRIFVSHSSADEAWCTQFVESLTNAGLDVWFDVKGLNAGTQWVETIQFELKHRDTFVVILTPDSLESKWVRKEIALAQQLDKSIIPVIQRPVQVDGFITTYQMLNMVGRSAPEAAQRVLNALGIGLQPQNSQQAASSSPPQPVGWQSPAEATYRQPPPRTARRNNSESATNSASAAPMVVIDPRTINFGQLKQGQRGVVNVTIRERNGASVNGQIKSQVAWLTVDRSSFSGPSTVVKATADTAQINSTGKQYASLQFITGTQHIYIPVTAEIVRAPRATTPPQSSASYGAYAAQTISKWPQSKYVSPTLWRPVNLGFFGGLALAIILMLTTLKFLLSLLALWKQGFMVTPPLMLALLSLATLVALLGTLIGNGGKGWPGRIKTTITGAVVGLILALIVLMATNSTLLAGFAVSANSQAATEQTNWSIGLLFAGHSDVSIALLLMGLVISMGAALGSSRFLSDIILRIGEFIRRHSAFFSVVVGITGGGVVMWWLMRDFGLLVLPIAIIIGMLLGGMIGGVINRVLVSLAKSRYLNQQLRRQSSHP